MKSKYVACSLLASVSAVGLALPALAQSADRGRGEAPNAAAPAEPEAASAQDIIVTGSRVIRDGSASPTPLTTVATDALLAAAPSGTISDALNTLPVFSGSRNSFSNPGSNATGVQGGNGNANVLNLRNLGATRTLVLFDGHRVPPTLFNSTVDVDIIPQELIQSVDVVTGGVSAVYGSDAVSGVVNYVLNRKFNGFRAHGEMGISQYGDAATRNIGGAFGTDVGDRGHFEMSLQHREADGILHRATARSWDNLASLQGAGTATNPYTLLSNVRLSGYSFGGKITSGALSGMTFNSNGVLSPFNTGTSTGSSCCQIGGDGAYQDASMIAPSTATQVFGRFDYDLTDDVHVFVQGGGNFKKNTSYTGWNQLASLTLSSTNAFLPTAYQDQLLAAGQSTFTMNEIWSGAPRIAATSQTRQIYVNAGIEGSLGAWKWNGTYTHGSSRLKTVVKNLPNAERLSAALDAVVDPATGNIVCNASLTNSAYSNCVPLNLFGPTAASQAAIDYVLGSVSYLSHTTMDAADAAISGTPFSTWAGPVNVALSAEWRRLSFNSSGSTTPTDYADCTSLRYNCTATTALYPTTFPDSDTVSQSVKEAAIEAEIPLLKDFVLARSLNLNVAARYTSYSTSGDYWTWKLGGVWEITDDLKLRGTLSRDIRAPTLYDLFQPTTVVWGNYTYLPTSTTSTAVYAPSINEGNPNLTAEVGHTYTFGAVYKPHFVPGLTLTVDYYHTIIDNAITTVQGFNTATQQSCYNSGTYCDLIQANYSGTTPAFYIRPYNLSKIRTYGIDGEVSYATRLGGQPLSMRVLVNYQPHIYYEQPGAVTVDQGGAGWGANGLMPSPSVQVSAFLGYQLTDTIKIDLFEKYRNKFRRSGVASHVFADPYVSSYATTNLTLTFDTGSAWKVQDSAFYVSVTNLFNAKPPLSGYYSGQSAAGQSFEFSDDPTGRAFLVGFRVKG
ncbi:TonB-dependent receptor domain-containing protein [Novosphingobium resinovorum]|uniref:TonB-dependent receptor domain-containing protein n=1 Tax=Novosphingobium resinovorum TaxID=158500 RepID=UPI002ED3CBF7|nr:TonB-dependent receptor [Novosphingobium resinovorum]